MNILDTANKIVFGARAKDYGSPLDNHGATAELFTAYLRRKYGTHTYFLTITAEDVCVFNILQKVSRLANTPDHIDSLVDIAGYAQNYAMCLEARKESE